MKTIRYIVIIFALINLFACSDDYQYQPEEFRIDLSTVYLSDNGYYFQLDNGKTLYPEIMPNNISYTFENKQRVLIKYNTLSENKTGYEQAIQIFAISKVSVSDIKTVTIENDSIFGNDAIGIESIWLSGNYINLSFYFYADSKMHYLSLVNNSTISYLDDDLIHLELRHNANNDFMAYRKKGVVSFDISSLKNTYSLPVKIQVDTNIYETGYRTYIFLYSEAITEF